MKPSICLTLLVLFPVSVHAQTSSPSQNPRIPLKPALSPQKSLQYAQDLMNIDVLWDEPLDWKETKAPIADVVTHAREALGDKTPTIEVRTKESPLATFELERAPLGRTLSSVAALANAKLWALPGRLLIAPPEALTTDENDLVSQGMGGEWKQRNQKWNATRQLEQATIVIVGIDVKERLAAKGAPTPPLAFPDAPTADPAYPPVRKPYEVAVGELSLATQQLLSDLMNSRARRFGQASPKSPALDSSVTVSFNDTWGPSLDLSLSKPKPGSTTERETLGNWHVVN